MVVVTKPSRKASARVVYVDGALFGNPGNWAWIEGREQIRACRSCRVVYPPSASPMDCPRHGATELERVTFITIEECEPGEKHRP